MISALDLCVGIRVFQEKAPILFAGENEKTARVQSAPSRFTRLRDALLDPSYRAFALAEGQVPRRFLPESFTCRGAAEAIGSALVLNRVFHASLHEFAIVNQADRAIASHCEFRLCFGNALLRVL